MSIIDKSTQSTPRILLGSDKHRLVIPLRNVLLKARFTVDLGSDYRHAELLWGELRHDIVLLEVSHPRSIESAIATALRIKGRDPRQFIAYLTDSALESSGLTGDAILPRDPERLPRALREIMDSMFDPC